MFLSLTIHYESLEIRIHFPNSRFRQASHGPSTLWFVIYRKTFINETMLCFTWKCRKGRRAVIVKEPFFCINLELPAVFDRRSSSGGYSLPYSSSGYSIPSIKYTSTDKFADGSTDTWQQYPKGFSRCGSETRSSGRGKVTFKGIVAASKIIEPFAIDTSAGRTGPDGNTSRLWKGHNVWNEDIRNLVLKQTEAHTDPW